MSLCLYAMSYGVFLSVEMPFLAKFVEFFVSASVQFFRHFVILVQRAMAEELGPRVRVNAIRPGAVPSRMADELTARADLLTKDVAEGYTLGLGMPEDIASMVAFLLSEEARWITGQCFTVDGGRMAH